ncbi:MAG TPA: LuxR C-terminal-related transcriptional regulator [Anaeromyxobacteraceae bacterium]|nr:LuxR C-terminal-related transcriptional regulator [Anaeromyxobacteraceae bacterium]
MIPTIDIPTLSSIAANFSVAAKLTRAEQAEVLRIAQGYACKDSAAAADLSAETIRARRKKIYRKLQVSGSNALIAALLASALEMIRSGQRVELVPGLMSDAATMAGPFNRSHQAPVENPQA